MAGVCFQCNTAFVICTMQCKVCCPVCAAERALRRVLQCAFKHNVPSASPSLDLYLGLYQMLSAVECARCSPDVRIGSTHLSPGRHVAPIGGAH